jgi:hypothetical protein
MKAHEIQRVWWLHDALWYQGAAKRFGYAAANEINQEVIRPIAKRVMRGVLADLSKDIDKANLSQEDILACFRKASDLMWPPPMTEWGSEIISEDILEVTITKCHAIRGIQRIGATEQYQCPCIAVREGWLEALGVEAQQEIAASMKDGSKSCLIRIWLKEAGLRQAPVPGTSLFASKESPW